MATNFDHIKLHKGGLDGQMLSVPKGINYVSHPDFGFYERTNEKDHHFHIFEACKPQNVPKSQHAITK